MSGESDGKEDVISVGQPEKVRKIRAACSLRDVENLRELAASEGGLLNDDLRRAAWPVLLGSDLDQDMYTHRTELDKHRDEDQVRLDVDRSFIFYPEGDSNEQKRSRKHELSEAITAVLRQHPILHYFQGYHDIVQVLLLVLGPEATVPATSRLSLLRIRDFMLPTMSGTEAHLRLLPAILSAADPIMYKHLSYTQPFFALAATLTLYAHDIEAYGDIARLFDFLLASEAVVSLYLFAVIVVSRRDELLEIPVDEPEMLHAILAKLPKPLNLDLLIHKTQRLFKEHPPEQLPGRLWHQVPSSSVLKTTRNFQKLRDQTLRDGEKFFELEDNEIRRREALLLRRQHFMNLAHRYRKPAVWTGTAVFVAFLALYLRESTVASFVHPSAAFFSVRQGLLNVWKQIS